MSPTDRTGPPPQSSARRKPRTGDHRFRPDPSMSRNQRRTARAVEEPANRLLAGNEEVLGFTEAVESTSFAERTVLGAGWPGARRVAMLFTTRRLIEIGISALGRRPLGRIRTFPWDGIPAFKIEDNTLEVRTWEGKAYRWYLRDLPDPSAEGRLLRRVNLAVSTYVPSKTRTAPLLHCSHCAAERPASEARCRKCDATVRTARRAGQLAIAVPGAGHYYTQRPVAGIFSSAIEILVFATLAAAVLGTGDLRRIILVVAAGSGLLGVLKLHSAWSARLLAERSGAIGLGAEQRWRRLVPVGLVLSVAALLAPLHLAGRFDPSVTWDLAFANADGTWTATASEFSTPTRRDPTLRGTWTHRSGQTVSVRAWPFERLETTGGVRSRLAFERRITDAATAFDGSEVLHAADPVVGGDGSAAVRLTLLVIDDDGRDLHELTSEVAASDADAAAERLQDLLERAYWIPAR